MIFLASNRPADLPVCGRLQREPSLKRFSSMTTPLPFLLLPLCCGFFADGSALELRYKGSLEQVSRKEANVEVKQFDLYCLMQNQAGGSKIAFLVDERGGGGWAWPERFGELTLNQKKPARDRHADSRAARPSGHKLSPAPAAADL